MKKVIGIVLNVLGALTFIGGVANLFLSFTDKWIMIGGVVCYVFGDVIGYENTIDVSLKRSKEKRIKGGFAGKLQEALDKQKERNN